MAIYAYDNIPDEVLDKEQFTSTGERYSLRCNENLKVDMRYLGKGHANTNSQGWERNSNAYFNRLAQEHPEMFSEKNMDRLRNNQAPVVDSKMIEHNPNWEDFRNQPLVHHHIGGDGEAVALPKNAHKGHGEIHNLEKDAGITEHCKSFSEKCGMNDGAVGKTAGQLHEEGVHREGNGRAAAVQSEDSHAAESGTSRADAVRSAGEESAQTDTESRSNAVTQGEDCTNTAPAGSEEGHEEGNSDAMTR